MRSIALLVLLVLAALSLADERIVGKWQAKSMGSTSGSLDLSKDHTYKLLLQFKDGRVHQEGVYRLEGNTLTLSPKRSLVRGVMKTMPKDVPDITLNLVWQGSNRIKGTAKKAGISKITSLDLWR